MRRGALCLAALAACVWPSQAVAADDYPVCSGDTSAADVAVKQGTPALRVGITARVEAGQFVTPGAPAKPEDPAKTLAALAKLRPVGGPFVVRLNRFFWKDGEAAFTKFLAEARRYSDAGYLIDLQVRYRPAPEQEGDIAAWEKHVREVVDRFGAKGGIRFVAPKSGSFGVG